jgi:transposase-like protein
MRGKKGVPHTDPDDPPRRRANKRPGHGSYANDRPPVAGVAGRASGQARLRVVERSDRATLEPLVVGMTRPGAMVYTDEWTAYSHLSERGRGHATVCHAKGEWARDDDGDGVREVHDNTLEGTWTGLRNFLRAFRGINKKYLSQYVSIFEWSYLLKEVTNAFLRTLLRAAAATDFRT